jgi:hypothetical protein
MKNLLKKLKEEGKKASPERKKPEEENSSSQFALVGVALVAAHCNAAKHRRGGPVSAQPQSNKT